MSPDIILVVPPFFSILHPSLGVSSLKGALAAAGRQAEVVYLNLDLADRIGAELHEWLSNEADHRWLLGEWLFAPFIGGERDLRLDQAYLDLVGPQIPDERLPQILNLRRELLEGWLAQWAAGLTERSPRVIGFSSSYQQNVSALALARLIKERAPDLPIWFGGANCEGDMGRALAELFGDRIDRVLPGEHEERIVALLEELDRPEVEGIRSGLDQGRPRVDRVDELPEPDFSDYFGALDNLSVGSRIAPGISFETSRGCWWGMKHHCRFCGVTGEAMRFRSKSAERLKGELESLSNRWKVRRFTAVDAVLAPRLVSQLFDGLAELASGGRGYELFFQVRADLSHDQLRRLAAGGLTWVIVGIESLDTGLLGLLDKGSTRLDNVRFLRDVLEVGIRPLWFVLHRIPGETSDPYLNMAALMPELEHLPPPVGIVPIHLDRFSPYFVDAESYEITDVRPLPVYEMVYQLPPEPLRDLAYLFEGEGMEGASPEAIEGLGAAVDLWVSRFFGAQGRPTLTAVPAPAGAFVSDTRSVAVDRWSYLSPEEWSLLTALRIPASLDEARASAALTSAEAEAAMKTLIDRKLVLTEEGRAISLVAEGGHLVHDWTSEKPHPGGFLKGRDG